MWIPRTRTLALMPLLLAPLAACATNCPRERPCPHAPAFDREAERAAVLVSVLEVYRSKDMSRFVLDPMLGPSGMMPMSSEELEGLARQGLTWDRSRAPVAIPDGRLVFVPKIDGLEASTVADWLRHAKRVPAPRGLRTSLPVVWFSGADWNALPENRDKWASFHERLGANSPWIRMTDVGFSSSGGQALVYVTDTSGWEAGSGDWFVLRKEGGGWRVVHQEQDWVA